MMHLILVLLGDYYFYQLGKRVVGNVGTRIGFLMYLVSHQSCIIVIRCFTNSVEAVLFLVGLYYYIDVREKFNKNAVILAFVLSVSFVIRNTSPLPWIAVLVSAFILPSHRAYSCSELSNVQEVSLHFSKQHSLLGKPQKINFIYRVPVVIMGIGFDSWYFGELTITSYNFLRVNILEGLSKQFGVDPMNNYVKVKLAEMLHIAYPIGIYAIVKYTRESLLSKKQFPFIAVIIVSHIFIISMIAHKEQRFAFPILSLVFMLIGYFL
jgi:phosphatidylinositol glycan class B